MDAALLTDGRLHIALRRFDEDLAAEQRALGCPRCGAKAVVGAAVLSCMLDAARPNSVRRSVIQA